MTPKQKAEELLKKYAAPLSWYVNTVQNERLAKRCAMTAAYEIKRELDSYDCIRSTDYWDEVINEIYNA